MNSTAQTVLDPRKTYRHSIAHGVLSAFFERRLQFIALHGPTASTSIVGFYTNDFVQNSKIMKARKV
ncbi:hypothetical protein OUZ56_020504 [Daphnia magna]|uniref:Uncharacterized protein n=1 Tax=Daphnia magna TaxID=35525 RepID=A0ABQ9ZEN2_9CRUS|nr:hypothetical protein OUZ56_020504 [Daphnia magna]